MLFPFDVTHVYHNQIFYRRNVEGYFSELLPRVSPTRTLNTRNGNKEAAMYDTGYISSNTKPDLGTKQAEDVAGRERIAMIS